MPYLVRTVFELAPASVVFFDQPKIEFRIDDQKATLEPVGYSDESTAYRSLVLKVISEDETIAEATAKKIENALKHLILERGWGINHGWYERSGGISSHFAEFLQKKAGAPQLNDYFGIRVFPVPPEPHFHSVSASASGGYQSNLLAQDIARLVNTKAMISDRFLIAFDLYSASKFEKTIEARFLTMVYAIESLSEQMTLSADIARVIDECKEIVMNSDLSPNDKDSLSGRISELKKGSISASIKKLIKESMPSTLPSGIEPQKLFAEIYKVRSRYVHSGQRKSREDMARLVQPTEELLVALLLTFANKPIQDSEH